MPSLMTTPAMHTGKMIQRVGPKSLLWPTQMPAPIIGNSSGIGKPIPAATRSVNVITQAQITLPALA